MNSFFFVNFTLLLKIKKEHMTQVTQVSEKKNAGKSKEIIGGIWLLATGLLWVFYVLSGANLILFGFALGVTLSGPVLEVIIISKAKNATEKRKGNPLRWLESLGWLGFFGFIFSPFYPMFFIFFLFFLAFIPYNGENRKASRCLYLGFLGLVGLSGSFWRPYGL